MFLLSSMPASHFHDIYAEKQHSVFYMHLQIIFAHYILHYYPKEWTQIIVHIIMHAIINNHDVSLMHTISNNWLNCTSATTANHRTGEFRNRKT